jgi:hypothetical protein
MFQLIIVDLAQPTAAAKPSHYFLGAIPVLIHPLIPF